MNAGSEVAALILAAGYSSRMQVFKPLLPLGETTVIEQAVRAFRQAGLEHIRVVVGYNADAVTPLLDRLGVRWVYNAAYDAGMYTSVMAGVSSLGPVKAFFLLPGDNPLVKPRTLAEIIAGYRPGQTAVVYPCFLGQRGHPPLIAASCIESILAGPQPGGLRTVLNRYEAAAMDVAVVDQAVMLDIDTPQDYRAVLAYLAGVDSPTWPECQAILDRLKVPAEVVAHSRLVAGLARRWAEWLNQAGLALDLDLLTAAGLLHDLAKGQPDHARAGADLLAGLGYPRVADIVAVHMDILLTPGQPLTEASLVYLADRLVQGSRVVSLEERHRAARTRFAGRPDCLAGVTRRFDTAQVIKAQLETGLGLPLAELIPSHLSLEDERAINLPGQARPDSIG